MASTYARTYSIIQTTLLDANTTLYPLNDLPSNVFYSVCLLTNKTKSKTNRLNYLTLISMRIERLIAGILRYDLKSVNDILAQLEKYVAFNGGSNLSSLKLKQILNKRIDGNQNIVHAAVYGRARALTSNGSSSISALVNLNKFSVIFMQHIALIHQRVNFFYNNSLESVKTIRLIGKV